MFYIETYSVDNYHNFDGGFVNVEYDNFSFGYDFYLDGEFLGDGHYFSDVGHLYFRSYDLQKSFTFNVDSDDFIVSTLESLFVEVV